MNTAKNPAALVRRLGELLIRYGLVIVLGWIGAMKFTAYEAAGIKTLLRPVHDELDVQSLQHSGDFKHHRRCGNHSGNLDRDSASLGEAFGRWQCARGVHFLSDPDLAVFVAGMGEESRRVSGPFRLRRIFT